MADQLQVSGWDLAKVYLAGLRERAVQEHLAGTPSIPGSVRRRFLNALGGHFGSAPGPGLIVAGSMSNLYVASDVYMNRGVYIEAVDRVEIGTGCSLGMFVLVVTSHHGVGPSGAWEPTPTGRPVTIGDRVWVGARATILPGSRIDPDVVVAAGAVVTGHLRSWGVYAGVPARRIRELRTDV